jgi:chitodextrinase
MKKGGDKMKRATILCVSMAMMLFFGGCKKKNNPPAELTITASSTTVEPGAVVNLKASATDPDGDILTYTWSMTAPSAPVPLTGPSLSATTGESVDWTAPQGLSEAAEYTINVEASDGKGGVASTSVKITVAPPAPPKEQAPQEAPAK